MNRFINDDDEFNKVQRDKFGRGFDINEFRTYEDCENACKELEIIVENIRSQIRGASQRPVKSEDDKAWRIKVQDALKYKELALQALKNRMKQLSPPILSMNDVLVALLKETNPTAFNQLTAEAQKRYPIEHNGKELQQRIEDAVDVAFDYGQVPGESHKLWVIDQMVRKLKGEDSYQKFVQEYELPVDDEVVPVAWSTGEQPP